MRVVERTCTYQQLFPGNGHTAFKLLRINVNTVQCETYTHISICVHECLTRELLEKTLLQARLELATPALLNQLILSISTVR